MNTMTFNQSATLLAAIHNQATGATAIAPTDVSGFVSMGVTTLASGYDTVLNAVSQVLSKTIFSVRPYSRKMATLYMDEARWGNHVRKITVVDEAPENDARHQVTHGESIDQQTVKKTKALQMNFYGAQVYERSVTIFKDQLDQAFRSPEEFSGFIGAVLQNVRDMLEHDLEDFTRATVCNAIAAKAAADTSNVIHLVTEYNDVTGLELDADTVKQPENFVPFMKWAFGRIRTVSDLMTERTQKYHMNVTGRVVQRHTPVENQRLYMLASEANNIESTVFSTVFNPDYLKTVKFERVNFWQAIDTPSGVSVKPCYINSNGEQVVASNNVTVANVFAILFDENFMGVTTVNEWSANAPFNAKGGYTNTFWHRTARYFNDLTENCVVFLLN